MCLLRDLLAFSQTLLGFVAPLGCLVRLHRVHPSEGEVVGGDPGKGEVVGGELIIYLITEVKQCWAQFVT